MQDTLIADLSETSAAGCCTHAEHAQWNKAKAYLVGGGITSLASAAYLIRDGGVPDANILIFEETGVIGGSLDGAGSSQHDSVIRGGRMFLVPGVCDVRLPALAQQGSVAPLQRAARCQNALKFPKYDFPLDD